MTWKSEIIVELANSDKYEALIGYLKTIWHWPEYVEYDGYKLILHTGGWSENEKIIEYLSNTVFWHLYWQSSKRGGHYYFEIYDTNKMKQKEPNPNFEDDYEQY
jgi:hypothetical protein